MRYPRTAAFLLLALATPVPAQHAVDVEHSLAAPKTSPVVYDGIERQSLYIEVRDGVRLAADILRPTRNGALVEEPLPLVWTHDRYHRATVQNGRVIHKGFQRTQRDLLMRGYIVAAVDVRGAGASFGVNLGPFNPDETRDAYDVTEWFAAQPWCDGNIGMYGGSYLGATQYMAASTKPPHLRAIIPSVALVDMYAFAHAGGIYRDDFLKQCTSLTRRLNQLRPVPPVDGPGANHLMELARKEHGANPETHAQYSGAPFRDSIDEFSDLPIYKALSPLTFRKPISESGVAIYHLGGWFDCFTRDPFVMYRNLENPQRLAMGPWFHQQRHNFDDSGEHVRWFDRWLKGIDNGIDKEPPIHYYVMGAGDIGWRSSWQWPLPNETRQPFYLRANGVKPSDGKLTPEPGNSQAKSKPLNYRVDYTTTSGTTNRWRNGYGGGLGYGDRSENDAKGMTFTTAPLAVPVEVTGHPVAHLWVSSTAVDGDFFVYLEDVSPDGVSTYVTEGALRASHRLRAEPAFDYMGLPYHRSYSSDTANLPNQPAELVLDLQPTSYVFDGGHRLRISITCADADNSQTPIIEPPPIVQLWCDEEHPSRVILPLILSSSSE